MITYFPAIYPDELLYSQLARYYVKSGYLSYRHVAEDLLDKRTVKPNIEFINRYTPEAFYMITCNMPFESVIMHHTMFPYYIRFLSKERRSKAMQLMLNMDEKYGHALCLQKRRVTRYLRYCPMCATEDRIEYGETYWHRSHQMQENRVCAKHRCMLKNTNILISSKPAPAFLAAEETISQTNTVLMANNELECNVADYVTAVFQSEVDMDTDISVGAFLHSKLEYSKYVSLRGEQRNVALLHQDFLEYYKMLPYKQFSELWQLQKVLNSKRSNCYEICMVAMFLGISVEELTHMQLPEKTQYNLFDENVKALHDQGLNYKEIATQLGASYDVVKSIGEGRYACKGGK